MESPPMSGGPSPSSSRFSQRDDAVSPNQEIPMELDEQRGTFDDLPGEMLLEIFRHLDFGDRITSRRVCRRWNNAISVWDGFSDTTAYLLRRSPSNNTYSVLASSSAYWKKIVFTKFMHSKSPSWYFPAHLNNTLTSLEMMDGTFTWAWFKEATGRFPHLDKVAIVRCTRIVEEDEGWSQTPFQVANFLLLRQRLKSLRIEVDDVRALNFYLRQFTCYSGETSSLKYLEVSVHPSSSPSANILEFDRFARSFSDLILSSAATLQSLVINTSSRFASYACICLHQIEQKNCQLQLTEFHFHFRRSDTGVPCHLPELDENKLISFIRTQQGIVKLGLPRLIRSQVLPDGELLSVLPRHLKEISLSHEAIITPGVFDLIGEVKKMSLQFYEGNGPALLIDAINQRQYPAMENLTMTAHDPLVQSYLILIVPAFPNLVHLTIGCGKPHVPDVTINDENMQMIIMTLASLQTLNLNSCHNVTDFGLTGINLKDCDELLSLRTLYLEQDLADFDIERTGHALSSLKYLKEISITGRTSKISDVGIYYGLGCKDLRSLKLVCGKDVSDWGFVQLARMNHSLERCSVSLSGTMVSKGAKKIFHRLLARCMDIKILLLTN